MSSCSRRLLRLNATTAVLTNHQRPGYVGHIFFPRQYLSMMNRRYQFDAPVFFHHVSNRRECMHAQSSHGRQPLHCTSTALSKCTFLIRKSRCITAIAVITLSFGVIPDYADPKHVKYSMIITDGLFKDHRDFVSCTEDPILNSSASLFSSRTPYKPFFLWVRIP